MKRVLAVVFITLTTFVALVNSALAHAQLDHCTPAPGTAVSAAPAEVRCWFTEEIDSKQSTLTIMDANNAQVDNKDGKVDLNDPDHKQMFATVKPLSTGVYKVVWHTITTDDNGVSDGMWYFGVGQVAVPTYVPPAEPTGTAATPAATTAAASTPAVAPSVAPSSPIAATPAVVPTPAVPTASTSSGSSIVIAAGVVQALIVIGVLVYLFRKNP
jgi:methionine-rich copper-binding protein CopC